MKPSMGFIAALVLATMLVSSPASARRLSVEIRTDKGHEAVYEPNDELRIKSKTTTDAYLLIYEIDAEGYVHVLFPDLPGQDGWVEAGRTLRVPDRDADYALVVQEPVGQAFIVAIAARDPFHKLPWYLRSRNVQAEEIGYYGVPGDEGEAAAEEEGITEDGRIVGDPFVAMERIRRQVVGHHGDVDAFATAYTSYYVHEEVNYPRYMCYDCHRPSHWNWWAGFDPYYARCSTIDFRVNWSWAWGPSYWFGYTPYFVYVYRHDCPPRYRHYYDRGDWYSSWNGYGRWNDLWGGSLIRYKSKPPRGYIGPGSGRHASRDKPPGYMRGGKDNGRIRPSGDPRPGRGTLADNRRKPGSGSAVQPRVTTRDRKALTRKPNTRLGKARTSDDRRRLRVDEPRTGKVRDVRGTTRRSTDVVRRQAPARKHNVQRSKATSPPQRIRSSSPKVGGRSNSGVKVKSVAPKSPKSNTKTETKKESKRSTRRSKG